MNRRHALIPILAAVVACGSSGSSGPSPTYDNIAGTYGGAVAGTSSGVALQGTISLTVTQSGASLGGSYSVAGTLFDGVTTVQSNETGSLAGTIASGSNPSVNVTATSRRSVGYGLCFIQTDFSGTYDSTNHVLALTGTIPFFDARCHLVMTYPNTVIVLSK